MTIKLDEQREWYEQWHGTDKPLLPVEFLKQQMRLETIATALEHLQYNAPLVIGCGSGDELRLLKSEHATAFDLSVNAIIQARQLLPNNAYMQADGMHLPFADNSFDLVLTSEVIEHILEPHKMMREIYRVLRPGGCVVVTTPNWRSFFGTARWLAEKLLQRQVSSDDQPVDHWSTPHSLTTLLHTSDLHVTQCYGAWYFPPTGLGMKRLPEKPLAAIFRGLLPLERQLRLAFPGWGHLLIMAARKGE